MTPQELALFVYNLTLLPIIFFSIMFLALTLINIFVDKEEPSRRRKDFFPFVTVQVPTFNDPIALRCIRKCLEFDYPKDRYELLIVDDSTNPETRRKLQALTQRHSDRVRYISRDNREGFKPGALKNAMKYVNGEIITLFDADWIPRKDYLWRVVEPFSDPKIAIVQTKQGFYNQKTNLITRFASYLLMVYHTIVMPINNRINCVFFCGTAGAIRKSAMEEVGGWNLRSITEDSDLSVKMLLMGYKTYYLDIETPSEVPDTFESFIKQQMRWCYGNARVFFDHVFTGGFWKRLGTRQKLMITFITVGNLSAPIVLVMTLFGFSGWFLGEPSLFNIQDLFDLASRFLFTGGFLFMGFITLYKRKQLSEMPHFILGAFTMGLVLAVANTVAFTKAIFNRKLHWFCTPKIDNSKIVKNAS